MAGDTRRGTCRGLASDEAQTVIDRRRNAKCRHTINDIAAVQVLTITRLAFTYDGVMVTAPEEGDVLLRGSLTGGYIVEMIPHERLGGPMSLREALRVARQYQQTHHIWKIEIDNRGRELGGIVRVSDLIER